MRAARCLNKGQPGARSCSAGFSYDASSRRNFLDLHQGLVLAPPTWLLLSLRIGSRRIAGRDYDASLPQPCPLRHSRRGYQQGSLALSLSSRAEIRVTAEPGQHQNRRIGQLEPLSSSLGLQKGKILPPPSGTKSDSDAISRLQTMA